MSVLTTGHPGTSGHAGQRDVASGAAIALVVATAAVSSWSGWVELATATRFGHLGSLQLAWLLPLTVDTYAFVAARAWRTGHSPATRRWGFWSGVAALALSIGGNAFGHAATAGVWHPGWVAVVTVAMIPPAILFAALLLVTMRGRDHRAAVQRAASRAHTGGGQRRAPALATTAPTRPAAAATSGRHPTHAAYDRLHAAGRVNGARSGPTYKTLAIELGVAERTVRRHMATYQPEGGDH